MRSRLGTPGAVLGMVFATSLLIHLGSWGLAQGPLASWRLVHYPLHACLEVSGALIGVCVALIVRARVRFHQTPPRFAGLISTALLCMSLLDGLHAAFHAGNAFVWFHSLATLWGGLVFGAALLPDRWGRRLGAPLPSLVALTLVASAQLANPRLVPVMVTPGGFTATATALNTLGGLGMFAAAAKMLATYRSTRDFDDLLFVVHCGFFGAAALMFETSSVWDISWWGWHVLRLFAFLVALGFGVRSLLFVDSRLIEADALDRLVGDLAQANDELEQFAYRTSHDLKGPLTTIRRLADRIERDLDRDRTSEVRANIAKIIAKARTLEGLIGAILQLSRTDQHASTPETFAVDTLVADIEALVTNPVETCEVEFDTGDVEHMTTFRTRLLQVLVNLISNGIKYRDPAKGRSFVRVELREGRDGYLIRVEDNGLGIREEHQKEVFGLFQRFHPEAAPGSGLGLSIVQKHLTRMGADIQLSSSPAGSCFELSLPGPLEESRA